MYVCVYVHYVHQFATRKASLPPPVKEHGGNNRANGTPNYLPSHLPHRDKYRVLYAARKYDASLCRQVEADPIGPVRIEAVNTQVSSASDLDWG
jgi:hypothetical protein